MLPDVRAARSVACLGRGNVSDGCGVPELVQSI